METERLKQTVEDTGLSQIKSRPRDLHELVTTLTLTKGIVKHVRSDVYTALDISKPQIRLLTLQPAKDELAGIRCQLRTVDFKEEANIEYDALSYAWGDENDLFTIKINGQEFEVRENLYKALLRLRDNTERRVLWIDAVCINQADPAEKNQQIRQMRHIYRRASRVNIWLGPGDEQTDLAIEAIGQITPWMDENLPHPKDVDDDWRAEGGARKLEEFTEMCKGHIEHLAYLFALPWFKRVWVLQEAALPRAVPIAICGKKVASYRLFCNMKYYLEEVVGTAIAVYGDEWANEPANEIFHNLKGDLQWDWDWTTEILRVPYAWDERNTASKDLGPEEEGDAEVEGPLAEVSNYESERARRLFCHLLWATTRRLASEPKDKIFAILGLLPPPFSRLYFPDYNQPLEEIMQQASYLYLLSLGLHLLCQANPEEKSQLPSWCVDFKFDWRTQHSKCLVKANYMPAFDSTAPRIYRIPGRSALVVPGLVLGRISNITDVKGLPWIDDETGFFSMTDSDEEIRKTIDQCLGSYRRTSVIFAQETFKCLRQRFGLEAACEAFTNGAMHEVELGYSQVTDMSSQEENIEHYRKKRAQIDREICEEVFRKHEVPAQWMGLSSQIKELESEKYGLSEVRYMKVKCINFATSNNMFYGKTHIPVEEGDVLCRIVECKQPVILRPRGNSFELRSFAYVPYIMECEPIEGFELQEICLI